MSAEIQRLRDASEPSISWKHWGPYLSERQWGTVREDYSEGGNAWDYFTHDQARSRAYRWGEDGLAGISDAKQWLCFAIALWNGRDPILKERLFGLTNGEGNHGEDVKECYFYLDSTPTHSYMKYLYKYPYLYPYEDLVNQNRTRGRQDLEYELLDTGAFNENRYFDVFVEYAKEGPEDVLIQLTVYNRGPEEQELHLLPTLWFRNRWAADKQNGGCRMALETSNGRSVIVTDDPRGGRHYLYAEPGVPVLFTENETNTQRVFGQQNQHPYVKDGINDFVVNGRTEAVNPAQTGTKASVHHRLKIPAGGSQTVRLRLTRVAPADLKQAYGAAGDPFGRHFGDVMLSRLGQADEFYGIVIPSSVGADAANVMRQALAGMMWSKQYYYYDVDKWLDERGSHPYSSSHGMTTRNGSWHHMYNSDIISMPDKWEYPWFAAWDLAFHVLALTMVDAEFGKQQLDLMLREQYMHPNGQMAAYEWNFGDVNPPVHAWSTIFTYRLEKAKGTEDIRWLERSFQKLLLNFTWWVNRKDRSGRNVFEGGFLGLDNIGVFDRSAPLPTGGHLEQADGTAWMALFCENMFEIALELAQHDETYAGMAQKFAHHFLWIASAIVHLGDDTGMWDEEDGFFYDVLRTPDGKSERLKVRSLVGLLPLCAATCIEGNSFEKYPDTVEAYHRFLDARPELTAFIQDPRKPGKNGRVLASILNEERLRRVLAHLLDENEFLSPYGIRSLSRWHEQNPYVFRVGDQEFKVSYLPAESDSGMFGGNSNWRGPIWMPANILINRALLHYHQYYGDDLQVECPTGSGKMMNLFQVAQEIDRRLSAIFLRDPEGRRPVHGACEAFRDDPHWRDYVLFYEYFHGDNGAGIGASHQTGWTGTIARGMHLFALAGLAPEQFSEGEKLAYFQAAATRQANAAAELVAMPAESLVTGIGPEKLS